MGRARNGTCYRKRRETTWVFLVRFPTDEKLKSPWEKIVINRSGYARWCHKQHRNKAAEVKKTFDAHESDKFFKQSPRAKNHMNWKQKTQTDPIVLHHNTRDKLWNSFFLFAKYRVWPALPRQWLPLRVINFKKKIFHLDVDIVSKFHQTRRYILTVCDTCRDNQILHLSFTWKFRFFFQHCVSKMGVTVFSFCWF